MVTVSGPDALTVSLITTVLALIYSRFILWLVPVGNSQTLIQTAKKHSRIGGSVLGVVLTFFYIVVAFVYLRDFINFMNLILPKTPSLIFGLILVLLGTYAVRQGYEVLARVSALLVLPVLMLILIGIIPNFFTFDFQPLIFPLEDWSLIVYGTVVRLGGFGEFLVLTSLLPLVAKKNNDNSNWFMNLPIIFIGVLICILAYTMYGNFGNLTSRLNYKLFSLYQNAGRVETVFMVVWIVTFLIKISLFLYAAIKELGEILKLDRPEPLIFPLALLICFLSLSSFSDSVDFMFFFTTTYSLFAMTVGLGVPIIFLILSLFKRQSTS